MIQCLFLSIFLTSVLVTNLHGEVQNITIHSPKELEIELISDTPECANHYHRYLIGAYQHAQGDVVKALSTYHQLFKYNPSPQAYYDFIMLLFNLGQFKTLIKLYDQKRDQFDGCFGDNIDIQVALAQAYLNIDSDGDAEKIFLKLVQKHPDNPQVVFFAASAYMKNNQLDKAETLISKSLENQALKQKHFLFNFLQSKIFLLQQKLPEALASIEKSLCQFPKFDRGWLFKAVLLEQMGKVNDAISGYKHFLDLVGQDPMVEQQLARLLFEQKRYSEAREYISKIQVNSPEYFIEQAMAEIQAGRDGKALVLLNKAIAREPKLTKARLLKIEVLLRQKKQAELMTFMQTWLKEDLNNLGTLHTFLLLSKAGISTNLLVKTLQAVQDSSPHPYISSALADLYQDLKDYQHAAEEYQKVIDLSNNDDLKSKAMFQLGYLYFVSHQTAKLESTLQKALSAQIVYPSTYNLLAYHYAHNNKNLPQALELVDKALAIAPECYYYLDTKGYILLKLKKHDDAIKCLQHALDLSPNDSTVQQHLHAAQSEKENKT